MNDDAVEAAPISSLLVIVKRIGSPVIWVNNSISSVRTVLVRLAVSPTLITFLETTPQQPTHMCRYVQCPPGGSDDQSDAVDGNRLRYAFQAEWIWQKSRFSFACGDRALTGQNRSGFCEVAKA